MLQLRGTESGVGSRTPLLVERAYHPFVQGLLGPDEDSDQERSVRCGTTATETDEFT